MLPRILIVLKIFTLWCPLVSRPPYLFTVHFASSDFLVFLLNLDPLDCCYNSFIL